MQTFPIRTHYSLNESSRWFRRNMQSGHRFSSRILVRPGSADQHTSAFVILVGVGKSGHGNQKKPQNSAPFHAADTFKMSEVAGVATTSYK